MINILSTLDIPVRVYLNKRGTEFLVQLFILHGHIAVVQVEPRCLTTTIFNIDTFGNPGGWYTSTDTIYITPHHLV